MPPITVHIASVSRKRGKIVVTRLDGSSSEYESVAQIRELLRSVETTDTMELILLGQALGRDANLADVSTIVGKTFTLDTSSETPIRSDR